MRLSFMKKILCLSLLIMIVLTFSSTCFAKSRYIEVVKTDELTAYLDTATMIKNDDNSIDCWIKYLLTNKGQKKKNADNVRYIMVHSFYYPDRTTTDLAYSAYDKNNNPLEGKTYEKYEMTNEDIIPGTVTEDIWFYLYKTLKL